MVAVCDDEPVHARRIREAVETEFRSRGYPINVDTYTSPLSLQKRLEQGLCYDVLFLDIDMPDLDGIALCRRVRELKGDTLVVFISNCEAMVFQVFEVAPFRFIRKSRLQEELGKVTRDLLVDLDRRAACYLRLEDEREGTLYSVNVRHLMYVEALRKQCGLHSVGETVELTCQFGTLCRFLEPFDFILIHRSYTVNPLYIYRINSDSVTLDNREVLPMSRSRKAAVQEAFFAWSREG